MQGRSDAESCFERGQARFIGLFSSKSHSRHLYHQKEIPNRDAFRMMSSKIASNPYSMYMIAHC